MKHRNVTNQKDHIRSIIIISFYIPHIDFTYLHRYFLPKYLLGFIVRVKYKIYRRLLSSAEFYSFLLGLHKNHVTFEYKCRCVTFRVLNLICLHCKKKILWIP